VRKTKKCQKISKFDYCGVTTGRKKLGTYRYTVLGVQRVRGGDEGYEVTG
jgi:hypothetical protein